MQIIVEYNVPDDDHMRDLIRELDFDGDWPGLMEVADGCHEYRVRVAD